MEDIRGERGSGLTFASRSSSVGEGGRALTDSGSGRSWVTALECNMQTA